MAINDLSYDGEYFLTEKQKQNLEIQKKKEQNKFVNLQIMKKFVHYWKKIPVFYPNQRLKIIWDCWESLITVIRLFFTSVKFGFFCFQIRESQTVISDNFISAIFQIKFGDATQTWIQTQGLEDKDWIFRYIQAVYWSVSTMVTILLYLPETQTDTLFAITALFILTGVFGFALNTIGNIINNLNKKSKVINQKRMVVNKLFQRRQISAKLREKVTLYLEFKYQQDQLKNEEEENSIIQQLSKSLQLEILSEINKNNIAKFNFLTKHFSQEVQKNLASLIIEENFSQDEYILKDSEFHTALFILVKGQASIFKQNTFKGNIFIRDINENDQFGVYNFFSGQQTGFTVKCKAPCMVLKLERQKFINLLKDNQNNYEKFYTSPFIEQKCGICLEQDHIQFSCPQVQYSPPLKQVIYEYNKLNSQLRGTIIRNFQKTYNTLASFQDNQVAALEIFGDDNSNIELLDQAFQLQEYYLGQTNSVMHQTDDEELKNQFMNALYSQPSVDFQRKKSMNYSFKQNDKLGIKSPSLQDYTKVKRHFNRGQQNEQKRDHDLVLPISILKNSKILGKQYNSNQNLNLSVIKSSLVNALSQQNIDEDADQDVNQSQTSKKYEKPEQQLENNSKRVQYSNQNPSFSSSSSNTSSYGEISFRQQSKLNILTSQEMSRPRNSSVLSNLNDPRYQSQSHFSNTERNYSRMYSTKSLGRFGTYERMKSIGQLQKNALDDKKMDDFDYIYTCCFKEFNVYFPQYNMFFENYIQIGVGWQNIQDKDNPFFKNKFTDKDYTQRPFTRSSHGSKILLNNSNYRNFQDKRIDVTPYGQQQNNQTQNFQQYIDVEKFYE
ncbi:Cyclic nucleotide-binding protein [Pseudocohnilembus persalinus]|uniref:Cyclic nucleotide-binding protein n=1 Tax=Pseudocohnilembus persalinus TaxID=266149 RepID=A0A0V0QDI7_PSEPJ|nr:Cyclic nucleotide-binding protein [Pseudocohnilembus persalinus]|eukprot:KRX00263.1 Cyclic nucleotide-binding protein [Pseudocohnilembus persalinus]